MEKLVRLKNRMMHSWGGVMEDARGDVVLGTSVACRWKRRRGVCSDNVGPGNST